MRYLFETFTLNTHRFEPGNNAIAQKKFAVTLDPGLASAGVPDA